MIQSMEILQLPIMALQERILQELQENPVLELRDSSDELQPAAPEGEEVYDPTQDEVPEDTRDPGAAELVIDENAFQRVGLRPPGSAQQGLGRPF